MKLELEPNMYVRYEYEKKVYIGKIKFISEVMCGLNETLQIDIDNCMEEILKKDILKASHNIIELIEEKDLVVLEYYVAKYRERIQRTFAVNKFGNYILFENLHCSFTLHLEDGKYIWIDAKGHKPKIKEILTKECFEDMTYKVV